MSEPDPTASAALENVGQGPGDEDRSIPESPNKPAPPGETIYEGVRLHPSTIADLALAIAGCLELPVGQERGHELFLNEAATQPIMAALADGVREVLKDYLAHEEAIPIAHATLFESVALGRNQAQHISPDSPSFSRYKVKMEFAKGVLWVRWETWDNVEGVAEKVRNDHILIVPQANIRHLTPVVEPDETIFKIAAEARGLESKLQAQERQAAKATEAGGEITEPPAGGPADLG